MSTALVYDFGARIVEVSPEDISGPAGGSSSDDESCPLASAVLPSYGTE